ncbi:MAG: winged helix-turn-helix transcriptional regulator, partial [Anaerolineae bacterium]|nr:winged helix-turn-helix transcriptional regulator [Anaerolineae bacterium]
EHENVSQSTSPINLESMWLANQVLTVPLTEREHEILALIAQGLSNQQIAEQLFIAVSTVKRHINNCYGKLSVTSRSQAILKAQQLQLV